MMGWFTIKNDLLSMESFASSGVAVVLVLSIPFMTDNVAFNSISLANFGLSLLLSPIIFSDSFQITEPNWWFLPIFLVVLDAILYWVHRFCHRVKAHWQIHHKPAKNALQCLELDTLEFFVWFSPVVVVGRILPIPRTGAIVFHLLFFSLQLAIHCGKDIQWPIFISPADHAIHHSRHHYNYANIFKMTDKIFGTYYYPQVVPNR
ncbi:expressed unknown protein [Seminavis robusta]|uniref:Fatty acid hydroxylase domain-containing protein n=1 Tax=Seminavis robusta TaxID=568900 RepID=A0A9N8DGD8_9STRA|nr:expressed unknown protein [Seminavis robusta]|eukprot:Sro75_g041021.1  (205) ;mRNA; r:20923-21537